MEDHPGAAVGAGDVDCRVPGDRAGADRAAQSLPPEVRQGGRIAESMVRAAKLRLTVVMTAFLPMG
jgi:hypothetical protein